MIDEREFSAALEPLLSRGVGFALSILGDKVSAEDAVQQSALNAWEKREQFDSSRRFSAWWFGILRNQCLDALRRRAREPVDVDIDTAELPSQASGPSQENLAVVRAMQKLSPQHNEILRLRYYGDLSYQELADVLEIPRGTVMSRLYLARKALARELATEAT